MPLHQLLSDLAILWSMACSSWCLKETPEVAVQITKKFTGYGGCERSLMANPFVENNCRWKIWLKDWSLKNLRLAMLFSLLKLLIIYSRKISKFFRSKLTKLWYTSLFFLIVAKEKILDKISWRWTSKEAEITALLVTTPTERPVVCDL